MDPFGMIELCRLEAVHCRDVGARPAAGSRQRRSGTATGDNAGRIDRGFAALVRIVGGLAGRVGNAGRHERAAASVSQDCGDA